MKSNYLLINMLKVCTLKNLIVFVRYEKKHLNPPL